MKYLLILLVLMGCSKAEHFSVDNLYLGSMCTCLAVRRNLDIHFDYDEKEDSKSTCTVSHKTEPNWTEVYTVQKLEGVRSVRTLEKFKLAPQFEDCMRSKLGKDYLGNSSTGERYRTLEKCSKKIFNVNSMFQHDICWGF